MKNTLLIVLFCIGLFFLSLLCTKVQAASFNPSLLISDGDFTNVNSMDTGAVQRFLQDRNSYLKDFSEGGRSAAQIIAEAARGHGDASGTFNGIVINSSTGTVSAGVILTTLQKEQSLVSATSPSQTAINAAMGYACPDSGGCSSNYAGFTKQVENAAWQLRYNYERAQGHGFGDYQVGQSFNYDGDSGTFSNRATASLYRYTPHVYNGNYNFWNLFYNTYKLSLPEYFATHAGQSGAISLAPGQSTWVSVQFTNSGNETWSGSGQYPVSLAIDKSWASQTAWQGPGWISQNRIVRASEGDVAPGAIGTFNFQVSCPTSMLPGQHRFYARLVADGATWFENPDTNGGAWWTINVPKPQAVSAGQSSSVTAFPGQEVDMSVNFRNTGSSTWSSSSPPMNLALDKYQNEGFMSQFNQDWVSSNRIAALPTSSVAPGETAAFNFQIKIPSGLAPGNYRFYVRLVQDGFAWCEPDINGGAWWSITVPRPQAQWVGQSSSPTVSRGESTQLSVTFRNTTGATWRSGGPTPVSLALDKFWSSQTAWQGTGWISQNRIASATEGDIAPGETGTFVFNIAAPWSMPSGKHRFYVRLVTDNFSWFENPDTNGAAWWEITVP